MSSSSPEHILAPATVALAFAVVRTKPPKVTIDDHLADIVDRISTKPAHTNDVEASGYWKTQYQQAQADKTDLEDEVAQLRYELQKLKDARPAVGKRRAETEATKANTQSKRRRLQDLPDETLDDSQPEYVETNTSSETSAILHRFFVLRQLNSNTLTDAVALRKGLTRLCSSMSSFSGREYELVDRIVPLYLCVIKTLRLIYDISVDATSTGACNDVVKLFQSFLSRFYQIALDEAVRKEQEEQNKSRKPKSNSRVVKTTGKEDEQRCHARLTALAQTMSLLFSSIDIVHRADSDLCEALITVLFDHIGSELSLLVFHDPNLPGTGLAPVTGLLDTAHIQPDLSIACAEISASYLVKLLKAALAATRTDQSQQNKAINGRGGSCDSTGLQKVSISLRAEERLQHTLLRGMFGDEDGSFKHAFVRRDETDSTGDQADEEQERPEPGATGFIGQVWELLGWDTLSGNLARN